ncbi:MAG: glycosyltransferase family 1 protein [Pseudomonadota bacterium]
MLSDLAHGRREPGRADMVSRLTGNGQRMRHRVEADLRSVCLARALPSLLPKMLRAWLPKSCVYLNVGHSNYSDRVLRALPQDVTNALMVHDTIPLDHPGFVVPGRSDQMRAMLIRAAQAADRVIVPSIAVQARLSQHIDPDKLLVAPLGITPLAAEPLPINASSKPYFVVIGTIEPRKNHRMLLEAWSLLQDPPELHIIGRRGWRNTELFALLDQHPLQGSKIFEHNQMDDGEAHGYLAGATALLMPSYAEGFGLPPLEAWALGTPAVVSDLPVFRETLGACGIYVDADDAYAWSTIIRRLTEGTQTLPATPKIPTWREHFEAVEQALRF